MILISAVIPNDILENCDAEFHFICTILFLELNLISAKKRVFSFASVLIFLSFYEKKIYLRCLVIYQNFI